MHIAASDPLRWKRKFRPRNYNKERAIYQEQLKSSGKPDNILEKIVDGKIKKFYTEVCLLEQIFVIDNKTPIKGLLLILIKRITIILKLIILLYINLVRII